MSSRPVTTTAAKKPAANAADRSRMIIPATMASVTGEVLGMPEVVSRVVERDRRRKADHEQQAEAEESRERDRHGALGRAGTYGDGGRGSRSSWVCLQPPHRRQRGILS